MVEKNNLRNQIFVDSAGTIGYHTGECSDDRMTAQAEKRGYKMTHLARQFDPKQDFHFFDYIIVMDDSNYRDIKALDSNHLHAKKIYRMSDFGNDIKEVPDPYYGDEKAFNYVLDILEDACINLLNRVKLDLDDQN